ncbi:MAG: hypothetical protein QOF19_3007 [Alphaproteobacteria bacterium]|jgi:hypothetical protein|nr:hypothetical protein [Alphaproteobacteria bacterium]
MPQTDIRHVHFLPWKGRDYENQSVRILILGESHYSSQDESSDFTERLTLQYMNGEWNHRFWTQISQAITGKSAREIDRHKFWNSVAFYNYVQTIGVSQPREKPSDALFHESEPAFFEVLDCLRPTHMLAFGFRLWERLPALEDESLSFVCDGQPHRYGNYRRSWGRVLATAIRHPSSAFSAPQWYPTICQFLQM